MATEIASTSSTTQTLTGCVKWFNNGLNYGFITVLSEGVNRNSDIFVHQSNIRTARECFRTLYTGECVQFELANSENDKHPVHAVNVRGFNDVQLRCEVPRGNGFGHIGSNGSNGGNGRGRGNYRGNGRSSNYRGGNTSNNQQQTEDVSGGAMAYEHVVSTTDNNASVSVAKGRGMGRGMGRGRGRGVSA